MLHRVTVYFRVAFIVSRCWPTFMAEIICQVKYDYKRTRVCERKYLYIQRLKQYFLYLSFTCPFRSTVYLNFEILLVT